MCTFPVVAEDNELRTLALVSSSVFVKTISLVIHIPDCELNGVYICERNIVHSDCPIHSDIYVIPVQLKHSAMNGWRSTVHDG